MSIWATIIMTVVYFAAMLAIGFWSRGKADESLSAYAIGNKRFPFYLICFTFIATTFGAGNFIGHGDQGYRYGLAWIAFVLGEQSAPIIFAFTIAKFGARYSFNTLAEFFDNLVVKDNFTRAVAGILLALPCVAWVGGQAMGIGYIFSQLTGLNETLIIIAASIVFITYGTLGGILAVVWTELIQGVIIVGLGLFFYYNVFEIINFDLNVLQTAIEGINTKMWGFDGISPVALITLFLTSFFGIMTFQPNWQRVFASRTPEDSYWSNIITGIAGLTFVPMTVLAGMIARTMDGNIQGGATVWLVLHKMPSWVAVLMFLLLMAATMSTAVSLLNSAAVNVVNDCIKPYSRANDRRLVYYTKIFTIVLGTFSLVAALNFKYILDLASLGYTACGGALFPFLLIGLLWRKDNKLAHSWSNCRITVTAARVSIVVGSFVSIVFDKVPSLAAIASGGVLPGAIVTTILLLALSLCTTQQSPSTDAET